MGKPSANVNTGLRVSIHLCAGTQSGGYKEFDPFIVDYWQRHDPSRLVPTSPYVDWKWYFDLNDPHLEAVCNALPSGAQSDECLCIYDTVDAQASYRDHTIENLNRSQFGHFVVYHEGAIVSEAENPMRTRGTMEQLLAAQKKAQANPYPSNLKTCPSCGHRYHDPEFVCRFARAKMSRAPLVTFIDPLKVFCRQEFIRAYEEAGLSGLNFRPATDKEPEEESKRLYRVFFEIHQWSERDGVCEVCETKTNVIPPAYFNLEERYRYDFQVVRAGGECTHSILSRRALALLDLWKSTRLEQRFCMAPIMPGYLREWISPEPRLFKAPDRPRSVLVPPEKRPKKRIPTVEEWFEQRGRKLVEEYEKKFPMPDFSKLSTGGLGTMAGGGGRHVITDELLSRVARKYRHKFAPADPKHVGHIRELNLPAKLIEFYAAHEPLYRGRTKLAKLRILCIQEMFVAMKMLEPAATLLEWDYVPLASNEFGDMYLYNMNKIGADGWPPIVFASHEMFGGEETREEAEDMLSDVAANLPEFLRMAAEGELDEESEE